MKKLLLVISLLSITSAVFAKGAEVSKSLQTTIQYRQLSEQYQERARKLSFLFGLKDSPKGVIVPAEYREILTDEKIRFQNCGDDLCLNMREMVQVRAQFSDTLSKAQAYQNVYLKQLNLDKSPEARALLAAEGTQKEQQNAVLKKLLHEVNPTLSGTAKFFMGLLAMAFIVMGVLFAVLLGPLGILLSEGAASLLMSTAFLTGIVAAIGSVPVAFATIQDMSFNQRVFEAAFAETEYKVEKFEAMITPSKMKKAVPTPEGDITDQMDMLFQGKLP